MDLSTNRKKLLDIMKMPAGAALKKKLDEFLTTKIVEPAGRAGVPDTGAAIASILSAAGELVIPEDLADVALAAVPGAKLLKAGKGLKKLVPGLEKAGSIDYKAIREAEEAAARRGRDISEKKADTLFYVDQGKPVRLRAEPEDLYDYELKAAEEAKKLKSK